MGTLIFFTAHELENEKNSGVCVLIFDEGRLIEGRPL
jgi:hypothetical protein